MMGTIRALAYLVASILFILSLRGLSNQESAQRGNRMGVIGMLIAVVITALALLAPVDLSSMPTPNFSVLGVLVGALAIGDLAVWVGVSAAHRDAAFAACRFIIDEVKQRVPIWKNEHYASGESGWLHPDNTPVK